MTNESNPNNETLGADAEADAKVAERRRAVGRIGLFAAFTAPLLLGVLKAEKAAAASL